MTDFLRNRVLLPLMAQLKAGATPEKLATSVAIGAVVGTFPVLGTTTVLGLLCGWLFRLNHLAVQVALNVTYPLQVLFLIPLLALGGRILGAPVPGSLDALKQQVAAGIWPTVRMFAAATGGAIGLWLVAAIPATVVLRVLLRGVLRKWATRNADSRT